MQLQCFLCLSAVCNAAGQLNVEFSDIPSLIGLFDRAFLIIGGLLV